jgi:3',5'-cyclic AMP phosphodiesterase CpdA
MMKLFSVDAWLKAPLDRDVIARWTVGTAASTHALSLPPPPDPARFEFLALGDTGDSESAGTRLSPQDAVARELARDAAVPKSKGKGLLVLHTGDVVYMTGEHRLYERNFRRPYGPFLTPNSTVENLTFRLPFLPVPGNHDYYDVGGWAKWLTRIPLLRFGVRAATDRLFSFRLPEGGSGEGAAFMKAFIDPHADTTTAPYEYKPGSHTRLPNRYYRFTMGSVDFFALDSNTLEAPPPWKDAAKVRADAASHVEALEAREETLEKLLRRAEKALSRWANAARDITAEDIAQQRQISQADDQIASTLAGLRGDLEKMDSPSVPCRQSLQSVVTAERRWNEARADWEGAKNGDEHLAALEILEAAGEDICASIGAVEQCLGSMPESPVKSQIQGMRDQLEQQLKQWDQRTTQTPPELAETVHALSDEILDVQRELALERRRLRYLPEDYDKAQLEWLDKSLAESARDRPDQWRIVFLHHPLYTTTSNHCEAPDVVGLRENLLRILQHRVHLVISGHAHAFEWFRSDRLPNAGIFVTGGGGQISLRPSLLAQRRYGNRRARYESLRENGVQECAMAGDGPDAPDGEDGRVYHYIRVEVGPDALIVRPVGVRRLDSGYRREAPLPTFHAANLPPRRPSWLPRLLESVTITRDLPPQANWK